MSTHGELNVLHRAGFGVLVLCIPLLVAIAGVAVSGLQVDRNGVRCSRPRSWLLYTTFGCIISVFFLSNLAFKLVVIVRGKKKSPVSSIATHSGAKPQSMEENIVQLLIYDQMVYVYSLLFVFTFVWNCVPSHGPPVTGGPHLVIPACASVNDVTDTVNSMMWVYNCLWVALLLGMILTVRHGVPTNKVFTRRNTSQRGSDYDREMEVLPLGSILE